MIQVIASILFTLILLVATAAIAAEIKGKSDAAFSSYKEFYKALDQFEDSKKDEDSQRLLLDKGTAVVLFKDKEKTPVYKKSSFTEEGGSILTVFLTTYPEQSCEGSVPCICLCRDFDEDNIKFISQKDFTPEKTTLGKFLTGFDDGSFGRYYFQYDIPCVTLSCEAEKIEDVKLHSSFSKYRHKENYLEGDPRETLIIFSKEKKGGPISFEER